MQNVKTIQKCCHLFWTKALKHTETNVNQILCSKEKKDHLTFYQNKVKKHVLSEGMMLNVSMAWAAYKTGNRHRNKKVHIYSNICSQSEKKTQNHWTARRRNFLLWILQQLVSSVIKCLLTVIRRQEDSSQCETLTCPKFSEMGQCHFLKKKILQFLSLNNWHVNCAPWLICWIWKPLLYVFICFLQKKIPM